MLWEAGGLTPDDLERLTPAIVDAPPNVPALRMPMEALLWNLRCIHAVCDLDVALEAALPRLPAGVAGALQELQVRLGEEKIGRG